MDQKKNHMINNKKLIAYLTKNDFKTRFAGSYFGIVWGFIQPLVTILLYWFVFQFALKPGPMTNTDVPFVLWLMAGLVPWFFFSEAVINGTNCFLEYNYLVKKVMFDIKILPLVKVLSSLYVHVFFAGILAVAYLISGNFPGITFIQIFYYSFAMVMLCLAIVYFTASVTVFFKDTTQLVGIAMQVGVWMTPIMWNFQDMASRVPPVIQGILKLNPMFYIVQGYRDAMVDKIWVWERGGLTLYFWCFVLALLFISSRVYKKLKPQFSDVL